METKKESVLDKRLPAMVGPHVDFAIRFRKALEFSGLYGLDQSGKKVGSYAIAATKLSCTKQNVREMYVGLKRPGADRYQQIAKATKVSYVWLRDGVGDMVVSDDYNRLYGAAPEAIKRAVDALLDQYR